MKIRSAVLELLHEHGLTDKVILMAPLRDANVPETIISNFF
jgi:hypothetical protein